LTFVAPYFLASALRLPGHGFYGTSGHPEGSLRKLKQAFVSTILKQLAKPPFLPQLCSISSRTCNNPHHDAPPDRNQVVGYRRGLASLSVVKELLFRVHRNVPVDRLTAAFETRPFYDRTFQLDRLAVTPKRLPRDLSGGTYPSALRELAFQLFFWLLELPTSKLEPPENKKPGVERRAQPPFQWLCAKLDKLLPCARKAPHYRSVLSLLQTDRELP
jgi:hypothetical protein